MNFVTIDYEIINFVTEPALQAVHLNIFLIFVCNKTQHIQI
jgi:hypothetical protein